MSQELFNTSAPHGVRPGTGGFCTVYITAGMSPLLEQRLALLSGYRRIDIPGERETAENAVVWAHWRLPLGDRVYSVLSRVCDAGVDYSRRSNRFAHHLVLDAAEQVDAGPAWLLRQPGVMESTWDHVPRTLPAGRSIPSGHNPPRVCSAWAAATGDAGWAGVLAQALLEDPRRATSIVMPAGMDLLPLVDEALALLPPHRRWGVTFCTYFTELPAGLSCVWRGCAAGSGAAAEALRGAAGGMLLDLTRLMPPAPDISAARAARDGTPLLEAPAALAASSPLRSVPAMRSFAIAQAASAARVEAAAPYLLAKAAPLAEEQQPQEDAAAPPADDQSWMPPVSATVVEDAAPRPPQRDRRRLLWAVALGWPVLAVGAVLLVASAERSRLREQLAAEISAGQRLRSELAGGAPGPAPPPRILPATAPSDTAPADPAPIAGAGQALTDAAARVAQLTSEKEALQHSLDAARQELVSAAGKDAELSRLRDALDEKTSALAAATRPAHPSANPLAAHAAVDVMDYRVVLWQAESGLGDASAGSSTVPDRVDLQTPAPPAGLTVVQSSPMRIVIRSGGRVDPGSESAGVAVADLAVVELKSGRVTFEWRDKRRFRDTTGSSDWLAVSRVRIFSKVRLLATAQLGSPTLVRFNLAEAVAVLPDLRGVPTDQLALDPPATQPEGWTVRPSAGALSVTVTNVSQPAASFEVSLDLGGLVPLARTTWRNRRAVLAAHPAQARVLEATAVFTLAVRDRRTDAVLCSLTLVVDTSGKPD